MTKAIATVLTMLITSMYIFPISFNILPTVNTKMILAAIGLLLFIINLPRYRERGLSKQMAWLTLGALLISFIGVVAVTFNSTPDYVYASYIISMLVWVGGAFTIIQTIRKIHGTASVILIGNYLAAVGVFQCVSALIIDSFPVVRNFTINYFNFGQEWLESVKRLYGFGACLDTAGIRFSAILVIITGIIAHINQTRIRQYIPIYIGSIIIIAVIGNMIARTTTVGILLSLAYIGYNLTFGHSKERRKKSFRITSWVILLTVVGIGVVTAYYQSSEVFRENLRFGFEGFFSLAEKGEWNVGSNEQLNNMVVYPETLKTWIIGDGYFNNPLNVDPYYIGPTTEGYYMNTDIGYLRFIFYFGLIGLAAFSLFIIYAGIFCAKLSPSYKRMFFFLVLVNFVVWFKVATDLFCIFALFLMLDKGENAAFEKRIAVRTNKPNIFGAVS